MVAGLGERSQSQKDIYMRSHELDFLEKAKSEGQETDGGDWEG